MPTVDKYEKISVFIKAHETWIDAFSAKGNPLQIEKDTAGQRKNVKLTTLRNHEYPC